MNMKYLAIALLFLSACAATQYSNQRSGEQLAIKTLSYEEPLTFDYVAKSLDINKEASRGFITTDLIIKGVDFAFEGIKTAIKKSAERYHQEYFVSLYNNSFYAENSRQGMLDPEHIKFRGFTVERTVNLEDGREIAFSACFSVDKSKWADIYSQSKFYLKCDSIKIDYTKVKMNDKKWYLPWTLFMKRQEAVNMDIDIDLNANWIDDNGVIHKQETFGRFHMPIRDFMVGGSDTTYKDKPLSGYCYLFPRSATFCLDQRGNWESCYGQGDFDILVKVTESSKNNKLNKLIYDNIDILDEVNAEPITDLIDK